MRIDQLSMNLIDQLRAWFHPKDRHLYLPDNLWILSQKVAWETAVSKFLVLPGLVGFWPMSSVQRSTGQAYDQSGQDRHLTYNGNPQYSIYGGITPYIDFDGTGDYLSRPDETDLDIQGNETIYTAGVRGLTLGGWFWFSSLASQAVLAGKLSGGNETYYLQYLTTPLVRFVISANGAAVTTVNSSALIPVNTWLFVCGKFSPSAELAIFINDTKNTNTSSIPSSIFSSTAPFQISGFGGANQLLNGRASLCFLCANALPDALINMLYEQTRKFFNVGT